MNNLARFTTARGARRATRDVEGGEADLARMKPLARRRERRVNKESLRSGGEAFISRRINDCDVS